MERRLDTRLSNDRVAEQLVELVIFLQTQINVSWDDSALLVLLHDHHRDFQNLSDQVLQNGGKVDRGPNTDSLAVSALFEHSCKSAYWEAETGLRRP